MSPSEEIKEKERSFQSQTWSATIGLCMMLGAFGFLIFVGVRNTEEGRSFWELPSGPLYFALLGCVWWASARKQLRQTKKSNNQSPEPTAPSGRRDSS